MSIKKFTAEEIEVLKKNQYVKNISDKSITYTDEFKEVFMTHYHNGMNPASIVRMLGFDYQMLGTKRVNNIAYRYKSQSERFDGLRDTRASNSGRPKTKNLTAKELLDYKDQQILKLRQELEFVKKNDQIERKALSKLRKVQHQKNSK